jgi:hypothetical protein
MTRNHLLSASVLLMMSVFNPASDTKARPYYNPFND